MKKRSTFLREPLGKSSKMPYLGFCCPVCTKPWTVKDIPNVTGGRFATCENCGRSGFEVDVYYSNGASRYAARVGSKRVGAYDGMEMIKLQVGVK